MVLSLLLEEEMVFVIVMTVKFTSVMTIKVMMIVEMVLKTVISWHWQYGDNDGRHDIGDGEISIFVLVVVVEAVVMTIVEMVLETAMIVELAIMSMMIVKVVTVMVMVVAAFVIVMMMTLGVG